MAHTFDLDAYLSRIGYHGARTATLDSLRALHTRHAITVAFEDLDPFLGRPVSLNLADLEAKMVHGRRGGYCFEQNTLFQNRDFPVLNEYRATLGGLFARMYGLTGAQQSAINGFQQAADAAFVRHHQR